MKILTTLTAAAVFACCATPAKAQMFGPVLDPTPEMNLDAGYLLGACTKAMDLLEGRRDLLNNDALDMGVCMGVSRTRISNPIRALGMPRLWIC